ncbi:hypothetical protein [Listeria aquatica]|uniref:Uncharacterized protein n=1 Tax=Listeria aquatica FSL S10-1188 TaxID=1265818 RepID=W7ATP5_9LIST|nr:hypothetical protein [Listeria aquatica]EUJ16560.1 hypothetical protein MAQA_15926 [Listeria aquatica FSL S10-1188]
MKKMQIGLIITLFIAVISVSFSITLWQNRVEMKQELSSFKQKNEEKDRKIQQYRNQTIKKESGNNQSQKSSSLDQATDILVANKKLMDALFNYTTIDNRLDRAKDYLTESQYQKMKEQQSDQQQNETKSTLQELKAFPSTEATANSQVVMNEITTQIKVEETVTLQRMYVKVDFEKTDGEWKATNLLFTAVPTNDVKQVEEK